MCQYGPPDALDQPARRSGAASSQRPTLDRDSASEPALAPERSDRSRTPDRRRGPPAFANLRNVATQPNDGADRPQPKPASERAALHCRIFARKAAERTPAAQPGRPTLSIFYGCSGFAGREDGFAAWAQKVAGMLGYNCSVVEADIENGVDLAEQSVWDRELRGLASESGHAGGGALLPSVLDLLDSEVGRVRAAAASRPRAAGPLRAGRSPAR